MITIKDMNERWLNEVKDYIIDSTIREYNIAYWDFLTSQVDNLEDYSSDRKDALAFNVKNMGYADYDEINKAFKKLGHNDLDAQDFSEDIYEICQFDNETIFHDIEDYLEVPFYAMGRMGGHWGVLCEDVCDKDLMDVEINEKELWKYIEKNYDLNDYDDIWDIDCEDVGRYADENCFNFVADKDFVKHLNDAWDEIKKQSDYMLTYDYAEYIAERLIEDNFLESKKSARKSIKESSVRCVTFEQIVDSRFDDISKGEEILDDRKDEIVELCGNDFSVYTTDRHFVEFDDDTQWRETYYVRKNNNKIAWDDLYKIVNSVKPCHYKFDKINDSHFESKSLIRKSIKESADDIITVKEFCFWGHSGNIVEIWTIDGVLCDSFEVRNVGKSEYKNYEIHGWDCAKNTVIIYIKK